LQRIVTATNKGTSLIQKNMRFKWMWVCWVECNQTCLGTISGRCPASCFT